MFRRMMSGPWRFQRTSSTVNIAGVVTFKEFIPRYCYLRTISSDDLLHVLTKNVYFLLQQLAAAEAISLMHGSYTFV